MRIQASTNQNYSRVLFFPTPPLEKRDFVGAPHTPPRGCRPLDPCFRDLCGRPNTVQIRKIDAHIEELESLVLSLQLFLFEPYSGAPHARQRAAMPGPPH